MKRLISSLFFVGLMTSCGNSPSENSQSITFTTTNTSMNPIRLEKQDSSCTGTFSIDDEALFSLNQFINGVEVMTEISFQNQIKGNYVESIDSSRPISETKYGQDISITAVLSYIPSKGGYDITRERDLIDYEESGVLKRLNVCPSTERYKKFSYEGSGLNISNSITKTYKAIKVANNSLKLDPISINVAPIIYKDLSYVNGPNHATRKRGYDTDNAFYRPSDKSITFLPQSKEYQEKIDDIPFWSIPLVASHEYAHHVFQTLVIDNTTSTMKHTESCFQNHTTLKNLQFAATGSVRSNKIDFAMGSMNEGFADLIASYSLDETERGLKGVKCFTKNREIESADFASSTSKRFSSRALRSINDSNVRAADRDCDTPDYQEIHDVGAMFAYGVDKLISKTTDEKSTKLKITLKWAEMFANEYKNLKRLEAGEVLFASLEMMYKIALDTTENTSSEQDCGVMNQIFTRFHGYECRYLSSSK